MGDPTPLSHGVSVGAGRMRDWQRLKLRTTQIQALDPKRIEELKQAARQ